MAVINGDAGNNMLVGTEGDDIITGFAGDDVIDGLGGDDTVIYNVATDGADTVDLAAGWDEARFISTGYVPVQLDFDPDRVGDGSADGPGGDLAVRLQRIYGENRPVSRYDDEGIRFVGIGGVTFGVGDPRLNEDLQYEVVTLGTANADVLTARPSDKPDYETDGNYINGGSGNDIITGGDRYDALLGGGGADRLDGGDGQDALIGGAGDDIVLGGGGQDVAILNITTDGADRIDMGTGPDDPENYDNELDQAIDRVVVTADAPGQVRLTFTSAEVGNDSITDSGMMANQDGGLAVRIQWEDAGGALTGPLSRAEDEGVAFVAGANVTFDVRDLVSGIGRGDDFDQVWLGTGASDQIDVERELGGNGRHVAADDDAVPLNYYVNGGMGNDSLDGAKGNDFLVGGQGGDFLYGDSGDDRLLGGSGPDVFFYYVDPTYSEPRSGNDTIIDFQKNDVLLIHGVLRDGNGDGRITFGADGVLDLGEGDSIAFIGLDPASGLRLLGSKTYDNDPSTTESYYGDAATRPTGAIEGTVTDDIVRGGNGAQIFFFDTAIDVNRIGLGDDRITGFGTDDILVTTSAIEDANGDRRIGFGADRLLDLSDGTTVSINDGMVRALEFDGTVALNGVTYFVYSLIGSHDAGTGLLLD